MLLYSQQQSIRSITYSYRAAVLLHGNGVYDGTECTEAVAALVGLSRAKAQIQCFAPNRSQMHVVNHTCGEEDNSHERNLMVESARISRGNVKDIAELCAQDYDALIIPGGFGAAKNLSNFGVVGDKMTVAEDVEKVLKDFKEHKRVIGLSCIAPVLAAKTFEGEHQLKMTMGGVEGECWPYAGASKMATAMGHNMRTNKDVHDVVFDPEHLIVTTPAYMKGDAEPYEVYDGMQKFIGYVSSMVHQIQHNEPELHIDPGMNEDDFMDQLIYRALDGAWKKYDENGDGLLTIAAANRLVHDLFDNLCNNIEQNILDQEFKNIDMDGDGKVSKTEMVHFIHNVSHM